MGLCHKRNTLYSARKTGYSVFFAYFHLVRYLGGANKKYGGNMRKSDTYRNEIKSYIVRAGMTMREVVETLSDSWWKAIRSQLSSSRICHGSAGIIYWWGSIRR